MQSNPGNMKRGQSFSTGLIFIVLMVILGAGCASYTTTNPPRSATEQLLLSTAVDHAMTNADLSIFRNQKVFVDASYFDSYDPKYAIGTVRDALSRGGARLVDDVKSSDVVVEVRSGALSIDASQSFFGIPQMGVPVPLAGALNIPQLPFFLNSKQDSYAKIALLAYDTRSRQHIYSSGSLDGKSHNNFHAVLFFSWLRTDIPEKHGGKKKAEYESWEPLYTPIASSDEGTKPISTIVPANHSVQPTALPTPAPAAPATPPNSP